MGSPEQEEKILLDNPLSLYILWKLFIEGPDSNLPRFIDRKKENLFLIEHGLIEFASGKKTHYKRTKITKKGVNLYQLMKKNNIFNIFNDIPLDSEVNFKDYFQNAMEKLKSPMEYANSFFYPRIEKGIGNINNIPQFKKTNFNVCNIENVYIKAEEDLWCYEVEYDCISCQKRSSNLIRVIYKLNQKPGLTDIECNICGLKYKLCAFFNCFYPYG